MSVDSRSFQPHRSINLKKRRGQQEEAEDCCGCKAWCLWLCQSNIGCDCFIQCLLPPKRPLSSLSLSKKQKSRLLALKNKAATAYDPKDEEHQRHLYSFGIAVFGEAFAELEFKAEKWREGMKTEKWKQIGFQGDDPSTDFRGGGLLSLTNLHYMVHTEPRIFKRLCRSQDGSPESYLPFAITGINITFMLLQLLHIRTPRTVLLSDDDIDVFLGFCGLLESEEYAFDEVYKASFQYLEELWTDHHAKWMDFQDMMHMVREQVADVLSRRPLSVAEFNAMMAEEPALLDGTNLHSASDALDLDSYNDED